jgi:hypothetical protein
MDNVQVTRQLLTSDVIYGCGLFAFIGTDPKKYFSWDKFTILGIYNDSRGGDACGRIANNKVQWGIGTLKKYTDFSGVVNPISKIVDSNIVLGHCRKASSGGKEDYYAQPVVLFKKDIDMSRIKDTHMIAALKKVTDDTIVFSGIHNGTIDNYLELAHEYKIPLENHNDSRVLLSILFYGEYKVLVEYIGTAALIWHNHLLNKSYVYKGKSKTWNTIDTLSEERPLHAWKINDHNIYLSSIPESLKSIQDVKEDTFNVKPNTLYKFKDGVNFKNERYDRSKSLQNKVYKNDVSYNNRYPRIYDSHSQLPFRSNAGYRDTYEYANRDFDDDYYHTLRGEDMPWDKEKNGSSTTDKESFVRTFHFKNTEKEFRISFEKNNSILHKSFKKVIYNKSRYWINGNLMHGVYALSQGGVIPNNLTTQEMIMLKLYYFIEGIMLDGLQAYRAALKLHQEFLTDLYDVLLDIVYTEEMFTFNMAKYSRFPIAPLLNLKGDEECFKPINSGVDPLKARYSGDYFPLFSSNRYYYNDGKLDKIEVEKSTRALVHDHIDHNAVITWFREVNKEVPMDWVNAVGLNLYKMTNYYNPISPLQRYIANHTSLIGTDQDVLNIYTVNYMRDFDPLTKTDCAKCSYEKTMFIDNCIKCKDLQANFNIMLKNRFNEVAKH